MVRATLWCTDIFPVFFFFFIYFLFFFTDVYKWISVSSFAWKKNKENLFLKIYSVYYIPVGIVSPVIFIRIYGRDSIHRIRACCSLFLIYKVCKIYDIFFFHRFIFTDINIIHSIINYLQGITGYFWNRYENFYDYRYYKYCIRY